MEGFVSKIQIWVALGLFAVFLLIWWDKKDSGRYIVMPGNENILDTATGETKVLKYIQQQTEKK